MEDHLAKGNNTEADMLVTTRQSNYHEFLSLRDALHKYHYQKSPLIILLLSCKSSFLTYKNKEISRISFLLASRNLSVCTCGLSGQAGGGNSQCLSSTVYSIEPPLASDYH